MNAALMALVLALPLVQQEPLPGDVNCPRPAALANAEHQADLYCMANAIYFESRGEPIEGQEAVAWAIAGRIHSRHYAETVCEVVWQSGQFSFVNDGLCNFPNTESEQWEDALELANFVLSRSSLSPFPATFFVNHAIAKPGPAAWIHDNKVFLTKIGQHSFYGELDDLLAWCSDNVAIETISLNTVTLELHKKFCTGNFDFGPTALQAEATR